VWALQVNPTFTEFTAGCRDGSVYRVDTATSQARLLFDEHSSVMKLLLQEDDTIWAATTSPTIHKWEAKATFRAEPPSDSSVSSASPVPPQKATPSSLDNQKVLYETPMANIEGLPGIVRYHITNNKRYILTLDSNHCVQLYDVLQVGDFFFSPCCQEKMLILYRSKTGQESPGLREARL